MTYKKLILASGALAATTTAVRVTKFGDSAVELGEELFNDTFAVTGDWRIDLALAAW